MGHEIKIGGVSLVVDDPRGQLAHAAESELRVEHQEAEALEASVRTVQNRPSVSVINATDPMGSVHARVALVDKMVNGRQGRASLGMMWMLFGTPLIFFGIGIGFHLYEDWHHLQGSQLQTLMTVGLVTELCITLCLGLMLRRTVRVIRGHRGTSNAS